jgi:uncharacterized membrane protein YgcG
LQSVQEEQDEDVKPVTPERAAKRAARLTPAATAAAGIVVAVSVKVCIVVVFVAAAATVVTAATQERQLDLNHSAARACTGPSTCITSGADSGAGGARGETESGRDGGGGGGGAAPEPARGGTAAAVRLRG